MSAPEKPAAAADTASTPVYTVRGYQSCGYAHRACRRVEQLAATGAGRARCVLTSRGEYLAWLDARRGLAARVPSHHRTSPACFEGDAFVGGCDELAAYLSRKDPSGGGGGGGGGFCAVQ